MTTTSVYAGGCCFGARLIGPMRVNSEILVTSRIIRCWFGLADLEIQIASGDFEAGMTPEGVARVRSVAQLPLHSRAWFRIAVAGGRIEKPVRRAISSLTGSVKDNVTSFARL